MNEIIVSSKLTETVKEEAEDNNENAESKGLDDDDGCLPPELKKKNPLQHDICSDIFNCKQDPGEVPQNANIHVEENLEPNEEIIKQEIIEFEDYKLGHIDNESACRDEPVDGKTVDDSERIEQTTELEPQASQNLVNMLEKRDYSAPVKPPVKKSRYKNPPPRIECEHCGKTFVIRYRLALHRIKEHGSTEIAVPNKETPQTILPRNFHCDQCKKSYHLKTNLAIHKEKVHGTGKAPLKGVKNVEKRTCWICEKKLIKLRPFIYHLKFVHGETVDETKFVRCPRCRRTLITAEEMAHHVCLKEIRATTEKERPFKCDLCDKAYPMSYPLEDHFSVHPEYQHFKCDQCSKGFFKERQLNKHKKEIHKTRETYIGCEICNKLFKNRESWRHHQETHNDRSLYCCEHCGKEFKARTYLNKHKSTVHPEHISETALANRSIPCTICGLTIRGRSNFNLHMRTHNNDPPHKCSFPSCDKAFFTNTKKKIHEQSHTKDYKYKCNFCEYGTVARQRIVLHEKREHNYDRLAIESAA